MQMVFGNKGEDCGTGVCFSRDPSTGARGICGEFLLNAQGEDVVAGIRLPVPLEEMRSAFPAAYDQLEQTVERLERHYGDVQDIEFTVEQGRLYLLQDPVCQTNGRGLSQGCSGHGRGGVAEPRRRNCADRARPSSTTFSTRCSTRAPCTTWSPEG